FVALFFFQAEDGIRDFHVTGVQTCALPIFAILLVSSKIPTSRMLPMLLQQRRRPMLRGGWCPRPSAARSCSKPHNSWCNAKSSRSEGRRVGKDGSERWARWAAGRGGVKEMV